MKKRLSVFIIFALIIIAFVLISGYSNNTLQGNSEFAVDDTANITRLFLADKQEREVLLEKQKPGLWTVNNEFTAINDVVNTLLETVKMVDTKRPVSKAEMNNVVSMMASRSTKVEIYKTVYRINIFNKIQLFPHEKLFKVYYVGEATKDNLGTYMRMEDSDDIFVCWKPGFNGFLNTRYRTIAEDWRQRVAFDLRIGDISKIRSVFNEKAEESFEVDFRGPEDFSITKLADGSSVQDIDTIRFLDFMSSFQNVRFEAFQNDANVFFKDSIFQAGPYQVIEVTDKAGNVQSLKAFHIKANEGEVHLDGSPVLWNRDRCYGLINNDQDFVLMQFFVFDKVMRPLSYFSKDYIEKPKQEFEVVF